MTTTRMELLLHPVRLRLVNALHVAGVLTTAELWTALADVPKATVYRQVERLVRGGVFKVESARQVRGAVERRYQLAAGGAVIAAEEARSMTIDDHRRGFTAAVAALIGEFNAYLDRGNADPTADEVSYRQFTVWLRPKERSQLVREFWQGLSRLMSNEPAAGRKPYTLSTIFFPVRPRTHKGKGKGRKGG